MGTGYQPCADPTTRCKPQGTVSITVDGGRSWRVLFRTRRPVVFVSYWGGQQWARFDDGEMLTSTDGGRHWRPAVPSDAWIGFSTCPLGMTPQVNTGDESWSVCTSQGSAGAMGKAVYRLTAKGWKRLAYADFPPPGGAAGGLGLMGYPRGISIARDGFGLLWEDRGPLFVTRDGGSNWTATRLVTIDFDSGASGSTLAHGVAFFLMQRGGGKGDVLYETTDAARSWRVLHVWH